MTPDQSQTSIHQHVITFKWVKAGQFHILILWYNWENVIGQRAAPGYENQLIINESLINSCDLDGAGDVQALFHAGNVEMEDAQVLALDHNASRWPSCSVHTHTHVQKVLHNTTVSLQTKVKESMRKRWSLHTSRKRKKERLHRRGFVLHRRSLNALDLQLRAANAFLTSRGRNSFSSSFYTPVCTKWKEVSCTWRPSSHLVLQSHC